MKQQLFQQIDLYQRENLGQVVALDILRGIRDEETDPVQKDIITDRMNVTQGKILAFDRVIADLVSLTIEN